MQEFCKNVLDEILPALGADALSPVADHPLSLSGGDRYRLGRAGKKLAKEWILKAGGKLPVCLIDIMLPLIEGSLPGEDPASLLVGGIVHCGNPSTR